MWRSAPKGSATPEPQAAARVERAACALSRVSLCGGVLRLPRVWPGMLELLQRERLLQAPHVGVEAARREDIDAPSALQAIEEKSDGHRRGEVKPEEQREQDQAPGPFPDHACITFLRPLPQGGESGLTWPRHQPLACAGALLHFLQLDPHSQDASR